MNEARYLCTAHDEAQAGLLAGMLETAGIPYTMKHPGAGPIYGSAALFGVELYVPANGYEEARALMDGSFTQTQELDEQEVY